MLPSAVCCEGSVFVCEVSSQNIQALCQDPNSGLSDLTTERVLLLVAPFDLIHYLQAKRIFFSPKNGIHYSHAKLFCKRADRSHDAPFIKTDNFTCHKNEIRFIIVLRSIVKSRCLPSSRGSFV